MQSARNSNRISIRPRAGNGLKGPIVRLISRNIVSGARSQVFEGIRGWRWVTMGIMGRARFNAAAAKETRWIKLNNAGETPVCPPSTLPCTSHRNYGTLPRGKTLLTSFYSNPIISMARFIGQSSVHLFPNQLFLYLSFVRLTSFFSSFNF